MSSPRIRAVALAAVLAIAAAACGSTTPTPAPTPTPSPTATPTPAPTPSPTPVPTPTPAPTPMSPGQLVNPSRLWICSDLGSSPQAYMDQQGEPAGSDIEIAYEVARRMNLYPVVMRFPAGLLTSHLARGDCDVIVAALKLDAKITNTWNMIPYYQTGQVLLVAKGNPLGIKRTLDLCGKTAGALKGSLDYAHLAGIAPYNSALGLTSNCAAVHGQVLTAKMYASDQSGLASLQAGSIAAYLMDSTRAGTYLLAHPGALDYVPGIFLDATKEGIVVRKNLGELQGGIKSALRAMMVDGTYVAILKKYGLETGALTAPR